MIVILYILIIILTKIMCMLSLAVSVHNIESVIIIGFMYSKYQKRAFALCWNNYICVVKMALATSKVHIMDKTGVG